MVNPRFVIKAVLSGQRLNINVPLTVAGTVNYIGVEAKYTSEWDDCTVVCYIHQIATGYIAQLGLIYDEERKLYYFPNAERLTLTAGEWSIWFVGVVAESGQEKYKVTSETRYFNVYPNPFASSIPPGDITLDEEAIARATDAQNKANLLLDKYNAGELTGPKGDPGDPAHIGFVQASVDNTTTDPRCAVTVTESPDNTYNMQFAFAGIKGAKGDTGATGPKGDTGPQGAPGKDGTDGRDGVDGETIDDYVLVQAEQPTSETNKMWLKPTASGDPIMIPSAEEFEELDSAFELLDSAFKESQNHIVKIASNWQQGAVSATTGQDTNASYEKRCRVPNDYKMHFPSALNNLITIYAPTGFYISSREYSGGTYKGAGDWFETPATIEINPARQYRFVLKKLENGEEVNISPADFTRYEVTFEYLSSSDAIDIVTRNNPVDMDEKFQQLLRKTRVDSDTMGRKPLCLLHFSDNHGDPIALKNIVDFKNHYSSYINDAIHSGDLVRNTLQSGFAYWTTSTEAQSILNVIGNHDTNSNNVWLALDMEQSYNTYFAPFIANWGVTYTEGKTFYYKDYATEKVRLIVLDAMHQTAEQLSWFTDTLTSAITNNLHVIVFLHVRASWNLTPYDSAWDDAPLRGGYPAGWYDDSVVTGNSYPTNLAQDYITAVDNFIASGGFFVCWAHGHTHYKMLSIVNDSRHQLDLAVGNSSNPPYANSYIYERTDDTKTADNFNLIAIDTTSKLLKVCKVGVSYDMLMRECDTLCWNYEKGALMYPHDTFAANITEQPSNLTGASGSSGTLHIKAEGVGLTYQWQYKKPNESAYTNASSDGAKNPDWVITLNDNANGRYYRCVITNAHGSKIVSEPALVTVT